MLPSRIQTIFRSGFTLIELLVVIVIIGLLMGLLLPTLNRARADAQALVCMSNLRQISIAAIAYGADYGRLIPYSYFDASRTNTSGGKGVNVRWCWADDTPGNPLTAFRNGMLAPYLKDVTRIAGCPVYEVPDNIVDFYKSVNLSYPVAVDYGYNDLLLGLRDPNFYVPDPNTRGYRLWVGFHPAEITHPNTTVMFADSGQMFNGMVIPDPDLQPPIQVDRTPPSTPIPAAANIHGRHPGKTANVAWVDGHVSAEHVRIYNDQPAAEKTAALGYLAPNRQGARSNEWMFVK